MRGEEVYDSLQHGESQTVEFKSSLAEKREAIQTMVAFANSQGGWVFFGVNNDGTAKGVHVGKNTLENLAVAIRDQTYPSLPVVIEEPFPYGGKNILSVEVAADVPPVIGLYLYSDRVIPLHSAVDAGKLQAYRRVGRINQKEDFMRLRRPMPSDPRLRLQVTGVYLYSDDPTHAEVAGRIWAEEGSATAHGLTFYLEPFGCQSATRCDDLPYPSLKRSDAVTSLASFAYEGFRSAVDFRFEAVPVTTGPGVAEVLARCRDDQGITWVVSRRISLALEGNELKWLDRGEFTRRIGEFPPKVTAGP